MATHQTLCLTEFFCFMVMLGVIQKTIAFQVRVAIYTLLPLNSNHSGHGLFFPSTSFQYDFEKTALHPTSPYPIKIFSDKITTIWRALPTSLVEIAKVISKRGEAFRIKSTSYCNPPERKVKKREWRGVCTFGSHCLSLANKGSYPQAL